MLNILCRPNIKTLKLNLIYKKGLLYNVFINILVNLMQLTKDIGLMMQASHLNSFQRIVPIS